MQTAYQASKLISALAFIGYGLSCLLTDHMAEEFKRYGLSNMRKLTGALELAGGMALLVSYVVPKLVPFASGGLALLMLCGVIVRIRVNDPPHLIVPAFALLAINLFICWYAVSNGHSAPPSN